MKNNRVFQRLVFGVVLGAGSLLLGSALGAQVPAAHTTRNVIVVMLDGLRWQEVFRGADNDLLQTTDPSWLGDQAQRATAALKQYGGGATAAERRKDLMPFVWSVVAKKGQLFGDRDLGSDSHVINGFNFSYPGYSETLTGIADPRIQSNDNIPNPNPTVFTWLNAKPDFAGKVAAFGAWEAFNGIFDRDRCGFLVNAGFAPLTAIPATPELTMLNKMRAETTRLWLDEAFDPAPFYTAMEYIKAKKPRVLFIGLGETDEWGHAGAYDTYLNAVHRDDQYLSELWDLVQSMPEYRDTTTLIVLPDHGRGEGADWHGHGQGIPDSKNTWMAFVGPDTAALGVRKKGTVVTESEIAVTVAALLGEDYHAAVPKAGEAIGEVLGR